MMTAARRESLTGDLELARFTAKVGVIIHGRPNGKRAFQKGKEAAATRKMVAQSEVAVRE